MPVLRSNLLVPGNVMDVGPDGAAMPMQKIGIKQKVLDLLVAANDRRALVNLFMRTTPSIVMQQAFQNKGTVCSFVNAEGLVTEFCREGNGICTDKTALDQNFWAAWDEVPAPDGNKVGLVVCQKAFANFAEDHTVDVFARPLAGVSALACGSRS